MSTPNNVDKKPAAVTLTTKQNVIQIRRELLWRYIKTPLLFWKDGNHLIKNKKQKTILGLIYKVKGTARTVIGVYYEPYNGNLDSRVNLSPEIVREMLMPFNYSPDYGDFFYKSDSEANDTESDDEFTPKNTPKEKQKRSPYKPKRIMPPLNLEDNMSEDSSEGYFGSDDDMLIRLDPWHGQGNGGCMVYNK